MTYYSGPLAIVSSKQPDRSAVAPMRAKCKALGLVYPETLCGIYGAILAIVDLTALVVTDDSGRLLTDHPTITGDKLTDWYTGDVGFILESPRLVIPPLPYKGRLGLYTLDPETLREIERRLKK